MITHGQVSPATSGNAVSLLIVPPGISNLSVTNSSGGTVYLGVTSAGATAPTVSVLTTQSGCPLPSGVTPLTLSQYATSHGAIQIWIAAAGTITGVVGYLLVTAN